ncbi:MAG: AAA family ATPase [Abitibacteriaceae bacterium]|nr:AAA family ATPase [Abditibacteriaceae bacterium]
MAITELHVAGYRSIYHIRMPLRRINVLVGPNGCGKSNLYQSMFLLASAATGQLARTLAAEGGMPSALWAGPRRKSAKKETVRLHLGVTLDDLSYELNCGLPTSASGPSLTEPSQFGLDPEVKEESVSFLNGRNKVTLMERGNGTVWVRDAEGKRLSYPMSLSPSESVLAQLREPHRYPQLSALREELGGWRFYHHFRTDADAPLRHPQVGVRTPVLSHDGCDLAAALQTIREIGSDAGLKQALDAAFPGAALSVESPQARFSLYLQMPGIYRPFDARELSDGTLRFLCLLAALLSPRPPSVLALNEPETSLHPDLLEPLARLIVNAAQHSQLWITTHSDKLASHIEQFSGVAPVGLEKVEGATRIVGQRLIED